MEDRRYIALIGDLVASRDLDVPERNRIQQRLASYLDVAGTRTGVAARPLMTLGDEFQGLLTADASGVAAVLDLIEALIERARPAAVRFGLGVGGLTTPLQPQALGMDGPCFHRARAAVTRARDDDLLCQIDSDRPALDGLWGTLAAYALRERTGWSESQREAIVLYEELGVWKDVAARLGVSRPAVSLRHQAAGWSLYHKARNVLADGLDELVRGMP